MVAVACAPLSTPTNWPSTQSLSHQQPCSWHHHHHQPTVHGKHSNSTSLVNIFSDATQYQRPDPLLFDDSLCQQNYLQRNNCPVGSGTGGRGESSSYEMTAGSCLSSNHGESPPGSPPLNIPPPPHPPLSRAPSLGGSIGRASGSAMRHNHNGSGAAGGSGCPKCRFAVIATPTHSSRQQGNGGGGGVCGNNYGHFGYHHQHQKAAPAGSHHYGSSNSYSGEWGRGEGEGIVV